MKVSSTAVALLAAYLPMQSTLAQECLLGAFEFEFDGACTAESVIEAYADQVFNAAGATNPTTCASSAEADLLLKVQAAGMSKIDDLCSQVYSQQSKVPFTNAANRGTDMHFEEMFFNGRTDWQEEVETIYETEDQRPTSVLKDDAEAVRTFYRGTAQGQRVDWPGILNNFQSSVTDSDGLATCTTNAAMCCWPKDRQANDNNGNCAKPYDENCVDKDPADNTNLCFVDIDRGNASTGYTGDTGFVGFPEDNGNGEGAIHCHGLAWSNDVNDHTARYKANNLFFVSMYDHMYQRGYVKNIPGAPMCGCVEQMPTVSRSDCTQVDLTETVKVTFDGVNTFNSEMLRIHVDFNACQGIDNRNNDLWAYMARLYYQGDITPAQFGEAGRIITDNGCEEATKYHLNSIGMTRGYDHDVSMYTKVAGRDDLYDGHPFGKEAFKSAFWEQSLTKPTDMNVAEFPIGQTPILMRVCATCTDTHKKIWYRRRTPVTDPNFDLLHNILYQRNDGNGQNRWGEDFSLHSSYDDAVSGENPWKCPNDAFNYGAPFTGECSPDGTRVRNQYSIFSWYPGPRPDVAYYVNKPEDSGVQALDLSTSLRFANVHTDVDLGEVGIPGRTFEDGDTIHVTGSGWYIWYAVDMGHYFSQPWSGDIDVKVDVTSFTNIRNKWAKAGIMLRSDNSADATNAFLYLTGSQGINVQGRKSKGHQSYHPKQYKEDPYQTSAMLRIIKKQETVEFYRGDGSGGWILMYSDTYLFPNDQYRVGLAVTSSDDRYISEATFKNYEVQEYNFPSAAPSISSAPSAWDPAVEVGDSKPGEYSYNQDNGISYFKGYGTGLWGKSDSFFYYNEQMGLDDSFDVITYVDRFHTGWNDAKGGIMIRDSNAPDAAYAFLGMKGYYMGATFQSRATAGADTVHHQTNWIRNHQAYIKLSKEANSGEITASYRLPDTDEWVVIGTTSITFTEPVLQVGTAVTSGDPSGNGDVWLQTKEYEVIENPARRKGLRA